MVKIFNRMRRAWRKFRRYPDCAVLFVPSKHIGPNDPVEALSARVSAMCSGSPLCLHIDKREPNLASALQRAGGARAPREVVLFAHPSPTRSGFAVNPSDPSRDEPLLPDWWQISDHHFEWILAHVCYGARVLSTESWEGVFPAWLSYSEDIHAFLINTSDIDLWANLGKSIVDAAVTTRTVAALEDRVRAAYYEKIAELKDSWNTRNSLHKMHLQKAMESIEIHGGLQ